jgi:hypothetical protein
VADEPAEAEHKPEPKPGTLYSESGINTGLAANPDRSAHYPMTAHCVCGEIIRRVFYPELQLAGWWKHTGRKPGE